MTDPTKITINGVVYDPEVFPTEIKELLTIYQTWDVELTELNLQKFKQEAAMRAIAMEINARIEKLQK